MVKVSAEQLAEKQREISVAEFFEKNRQILGFDNPTRAVLTTVKEAVDNSLDACEEAEILPDILVKIEKLGDKDELCIIVEDNGPGIVRKQIPNVFGRLLYGSRFHAVRQARGQQGIGISAAVLYAQLTTGKTSRVISKIESEHTAIEQEITIETKKNMPLVNNEKVTLWDKRPHGIHFETYIRGKYQRGKQSVYEYLRETAVVTPYAKITLIEPDGTKITFDRVTPKLPPPATEIKPHPHGIELGRLCAMLQNTKEKSLSKFLVTEFSSISPKMANEIIIRSGLEPNDDPKKLTLEHANKIFNVLEHEKFMNPQTDCLSPIGELLIKKGLKNVLGIYKPDIYVPPVTRPAKVHAGNPFIIEVGLVYGGNLPAEQPVQILRFANRVPLLFQQGGCAITHAVEQVDWRRYGLEQRGGSGIPLGPAILLIHVASTKIPFTSESKEAIADIPEIIDEIKLALQNSGRKLRLHINKSIRKSKSFEKFEIIQKILPQIAQKSSKLLNRAEPDLRSTITKIMDVVYIKDSVEYLERKHRICIELFNYMEKNVSLYIYAVVPENSFNERSSNLAPTEIRDNSKIQWQVSLKSLELFTLKFELTGLEKDDYDENELYVSGIDAVHVLGADALPGDWELDKIQ